MKKTLKEIVIHKENELSKESMTKVKGGAGHIDLTAQWVVLRP